MVILGNIIIIKDLTSKKISENVSKSFDKNNSRKKISNSLKKSKKFKKAVTSKERSIKISINRTGVKAKLYTCKHCNTISINSNIVRWHNDNCLQNHNLTIEKRQQLIAQRSKSGILRANGNYKNKEVIL